MQGLFAKWILYFVVIYKRTVDAGSVEWVSTLFLSGESVPSLVKIAFSILILNLILPGGAELNTDIREYRQIIFGIQTFGRNRELNQLFVSTFRCSPLPS
jgi:hypothetical protein